MAVLNKIRQRSLFLIIVIALALFSFVLADLFKSGSSFSSKSQNIVATVNGKDITREDFMQKVEAAQRQAGPNATGSQVINQVFEQEVRQAIMDNQFEKLGISIEKDQMRDLLKTTLSTSPEFLNEAGLFDENKLNEYIANLKETSAEGYQGWVNYEKSIAANALQQSYYNMVRAGLIATLKEGELEHKLEGNKVDVQFVQIPYSSIEDDKVKVSTSDVSDYINKHKKQFEVKESRDIKFVQFNEVASTEDENTIKQSLKGLLNDKVEYNDVSKADETIVGFSNTSNNESFVNNNSDIKFDKRFVFKSDLPAGVADSIFKLNEGKIYGPYTDNGYYKLSKVVAVKQIPDSAKVRHILIPFIGSQGATPEVTQTEAQAKSTADSLLTVLKGDKSKFSTFVTDYSSDQGSVNNEGRYDWHPYNSMVPEFNDFEFEGNVGDLGVVKTIFGFHIIEIEGQKDRKRAIQVATVARKIEPSEASIDKIFRDASNFEIAAGKKDFEAAAKEKNYTVRPVNDLKALDENIPGVGSQRPIVRWAFEEDAKVGAIKRFNVTNGYVIAQLVAKHEEGLMSVEDAKATVMPIIRKQKKAELIKNRVSATSLDALAKAESTTVRTAVDVNMKNPMLTGAGREPLVVGAAFGLKEGKTSNLIEGENGVYMIKVTKVKPAAKLDSYQAVANRVEQQKFNVVSSRLYNALKEASEIEDNRAKNQIQ
ncbi:peptidylprolyl isomerase/peptidyl-prolyl cis-trans isomerase D [Mariniflexile fucanivorans]|uniref:Periplasmic chaperone PpiD n=1 Tax=Mariniflexile fucanivorans TaxID=264023 RepID=A0A4R1RJ04_9FLAO|nr:SurA N-terminal domain-containing protein [Mariniflexile fucanivorans]TCL65986.1 peptidylprolyl isomerase/peptidyl-prolyl cis-trans isomerase D [Mariniflexile fucanivorans]